MFAPDDVVTIQALKICSEDEGRSSFAHSKIVIDCDWFKIGNLRRIQGDNACQQSSRLVAFLSWRVVADGSVETLYTVFAPVLSPKHSFRPLQLPPNYFVEARIMKNDKYR